MSAIQSAATTGFPSNPVVSGTSAVNTAPVATSGIAASWVPVQIAQAVTAAGGYTLVNSTGNVITWTAPNDGKPHLFQLTAVLHVTVNETGGEIDLAFTAPDGTAVSGVVVFASGLTTGVSAGFFSRLCQAGTTVTLSQAVALSPGAARLDAQIWGA